MKLIISSLSVLLVLGICSGALAKALATALRTSMPIGLTLRLPYPSLRSRIF